MINFLVVPFDRGRGGTLLRGDALEAPSAPVAAIWAEAMAGSHIGAMAFRREVNGATGADQAGTLIVAFGEVDDTKLDAP